jgi:L-fucono-1,5-lactonase
VLPRHLCALHAFAAAHPTLAIVIDHAAKPDIARGALEPWRTDMARLAALPRVHCKLSGLLTEAGAGAGQAQLQPFVQAAWTLFGPQRLLWGSDWPVLRLASDYTAWRALAEALIDAVAPPPSDADRAALFGGNAATLYRL